MPFNPVVLKNTIRSKQEQFQKRVDNVLSVLRDDSNVRIEERHAELVNQIEYLLLDILAELPVIMAYRLESTDYARTIVSDYNEFLINMRLTLQSIINIEIRPLK